MTAPRTSESLLRAYAECEEAYSFACNRMRPGWSFDDEAKWRERFGCSIEKPAGAFLADLRRRALSAPSEPTRNTPAGDGEREVVDKLDTAMSLAEVGLMKLVMGPFTGSERRLLATIASLADERDTLRASLAAAETAKEELRKAVEIQASRIDALERLAVMYRTGIHSNKTLTLLERTRAAINANPAAKAASKEKSA